MMWNAAGMGFAMMIAGIGLSQGTHAGALAATVMIFLFNTFFAIGWLGITWLYVRMRGYRYHRPKPTRWRFDLLFQALLYLSHCRVLLPVMESPKRFDV
jgi:ribose/xylose/arabinose/galactoside ABC-type transport system permease subunit